MLIQNLFMIAAAYIIGCFSAAYYVIRLLFRRDIRTVGSGNAGARNAGRMFGFGWFAVIFLLDFAKGAVVVWIASSIGVDDWGMLLSMLAVIGGHIWPVQLRFCGGKGVATALGVIAIYDPGALLYMIALCAVLYPLVRNFTISGLLSFLLMPLVVFIWQTDEVEAVSLLVIAVVVVFAHRRDIAAYLNRGKKSRRR